MRSATVTLWEGRLEHTGALHDSLDEAERERARRYQRPDDRARYVAGRGALRHILGYHLDVSPQALRFGYSAAGKPFLTEHRTLHFNLTHADERFLVAVSRGCAVGVDLERMPDERAIGEACARVLSAPEAALFARLEGALRAEWFGSIWTRKEACIKADGRGMGLDLTDLDVASDPPRVLVHDPARGWSPSPRWTVRSVPVGGGYAAALAAEGSGWSVERVRWPGPVTLGG